MYVHIIIYFYSQPDQLTLTLFHTYVRLDYVNFFIQVTVLSEQRGLNDLKWHSVSVQMDINGYIVLHVLCVYMYVCLCIIIYMSACNVCKTMYVYLHTYIHTYVYVFT